MNLNHSETEHRQQLADESDRIAEDVEFTGYQHLAAGQRWRKQATFIGLPVTVLSAATSTAAGLSVLVGGATWVTAGLAFITTIAIAVRLFFHPDEQAAAHSRKGARYINLRDDARRFANIEAVGSRSLDSLTDRLFQLGERQKALREEEPREVPDDLYAKVKRQIESGNYRHAVDQARKSSD